MKKLFQNPIITHTGIYNDTFLGDLQVGDFNNDGYVDIAAVYINYDLGTTASPFKVYLGDGRGGFHDQTTTLFQGHQPMTNFVPRFLVADLNNDGIDDIFTIDMGIDKEPFTGGQNSLYLSNNGFMYEATHQLPQQIINSHGASIGDVNHDGSLDILLNALMQDGNFLQMNSGNGSFFNADYLLPPVLKESTHPHWYSPPTHTASALIDVNGNGSLDMILGNWDNSSSTNNSLIFLNNGHGDYSASTAIPLPNTTVYEQVSLDYQTIDLNQNGLNDLVVSITNGGSFEEFYKTPYLQILINKGNGIYADETHIRFPQPSESNHSELWIKSTKVLDFNHDGHPDIFVNMHAYGAKVLLNDGQGNFQSVLHLPEGANDHFPIYSTNTIADVNNDGLWDIVTSGFDEQGITLQTHLGTAAQTTLQTSSLTGPSSQQMEKVIELYIGFFGRAPEFEGLGYYQQLLQTGLNQGQSEEQLFKQIADQFWQASLEYSHVTGYQSTMSTFDFVAKVYENVLGRPNAANTDPNGVQFWTDKMDSEGLSHGEAVLEILQGANNYIAQSPDDAVSQYVGQLLENRKDIGIIFSSPYYSGGLTEEAAISAGQAVIARIDQHRESFEKTAQAIYNHTLDELSEIELVGVDLIT